MSSQTFKAIETRYNGYRFRSRLEARWAVFFDTLGIEYHYEPEGYVLDDTPYLPDFYLPRYECFIEIKGQEPTEEEQRKTRLLALYTDKRVYTFFGGITFPNEQRYGSAFCDIPPMIYAQSVDEEVLEGYKVPLSREAMILLQGLTDVRIEVRPYGDSIRLIPQQYKWSIEGLESFTEHLQEQLDAAKRIFPKLPQYESEIAKALEDPKEDWAAIFYSQGWIARCVWQECLHCSEVTIQYDQLHTHKPCVHDNNGTLSVATPRLIEAYTAARQARF